MSGAGDEGDLCEEETCNKKWAWKMEQFDKNDNMVGVRYVCLDCARNLVKSESGWRSDTSEVQGGRKLIINSKPCEVCGEIHYPNCRKRKKKATSSATTTFLLAALLVVVMAIVGRQQKVL
jgi:hypothetical protein